MHDIYMTAISSVNFIHIIIDVNQEQLQKMQL
jgi:hypothetical protein